MNDKLREALAIVEKYGMKGDVIYKEIEALAASKQEPQAQAEPEVVAEVYSISAQNKTEDAYATVRVLCSAGKGYWDLPIRATDKLITLQSHREAMAKIRPLMGEESHAAWQRAERRCISLQAEIDAKDEAIAKKDAEIAAKERECQLLGSAVDKTRIFWKEEVHGLRAELDRAHAALDACVGVRSKVEAAYNDALEKYGANNVLTQDLGDVLDAITKANEARK